MKRSDIFSIESYLPSMPAIIIVFWDPNAAINWVTSGKWNWANDHSELKYLGRTPESCGERLVKTFHGIRKPPKASDTIRGRLTHHLLNLVLINLTSIVNKAEVLHIYQVIWSPSSQLFTFIEDFHPTPLTKSSILTSNLLIPLSGPNDPWY